MMTEARFAFLGPYLIDLCSNYSFEEYLELINFSRIHFSINSYHFYPLFIYSYYQQIYYLNGLN